jgi:hypothetical protein
VFIESPSHEQGGKVPAAVGTVGDRFGLPDDRPLGGKGTGRGPGEAEASASGAGLLRREFGGLLFEEQLESPLRESLSRDRGDLLEGAEIDLKTRPLVPEGPFGDDFGPLSSEVVELLKFLRCEFDRCHDSPPTEVTTRATAGFPIPMHRSSKDPHKRQTDLASQSGVSPALIARRNFYNLSHLRRRVLASSSPGVAMRSPHINRNIPPAHFSGSIVTALTAFSGFEGEPYSSVSLSCLQYRPPTSRAPRSRSRN